MRSDKECGRDSDCEQKMLRENKFYFAFESKNCTDYITEKFWRSLSYNGLIPVVFQPAKKYYERVAPQNSYIHAEDFDFDPKKIAVHLDRVARSFDLYFGYFKWKFELDVVYKGNTLEQMRMCELCYKLNTEKDEVYYSDVSAFFNGECVIN
jgi:hypothetical protein